ncbi:uncharacterized protein MONBRDRAFT_13162 [Monosiga brevicollis MX1]|uniref:Uncharacterized protein n=1 Tax=Monosiga brevicollis TaxID=81824 RepID=A9VEG7_MONBE|nr:uncharacterized protein MONBRDRAFT_13162 [Monosiga brevicollis MX1]EDQ84074.1 predicted protein [Monosiga brevicollis MX1]|eukprot:XP_001751114.1 hypothetical protein [Monosiga brevicollis MX1]
MAFWLKHHLEPSLSAQLVPPRCVGIMTVLPSSRRRRPHNAPGYLINPQHGHEPPCPRSTHPSAPAPNQSPSSLLPNGLDLPTKLPFGPFAFALSRVLSFASLSLRMRAYQEVASNNCGSSQPPDPLAHSSASLGAPRSSPITQTSDDLLFASPPTRRAHPFVKARLASRQRFTSHAESTVEHMRPSHSRSVAFPCCTTL